MEHDIPPGGGINIPPGDNQVDLTTGNPVAPKVYFQAPGVKLKITDEPLAIVCGYGYRKMFTTIDLNNRHVLPL